MTTTDLTKAAAEMTADVTARRDRATEARERAEQLADQAAEAEHDAARAELVAARQPGAPLGRVMRECAATIDQARERAVQAVLDGTDAVAAWTSYRLTARAALGRWDAFAGEFHTVAGYAAPPGPGHRLPALDREPFDVFVTKVVERAEQETHRAAHMATQTELQESRHRL